MPQIKSPAPQTATASLAVPRSASSPAQVRGKVAFIESKTPDLENIAGLLVQCERSNQWANRGPLYWMLAKNYRAHMHLPEYLSVTPCSNGGIGLEALARFHDIKLGRPLRWIGSAFSFSNLGRGYFSAMRFLDCDEFGMLDLAALEAVDPDEYDGFVVTNIFGVWRNFAPYIAFAQRSKKTMLIDNAAGIDEHIPDWPYQSFSLHHTKPYGAGEGGLLISPSDEAEAIYELLDYGAITDRNRSAWLNNGKIADIACAFHIDRLAQYPVWAPRYREQAARVEGLAKEVGLRPLVPLDTPPAAATSYPFLAKGDVPLEQLQRSQRLHFGKYYKPLADLPKATELYRALVNIPTHPDVARLSEHELKNELKRSVIG